MKTIHLFLAFLLALSFSSSAWAKKTEPKNKIGVIHYTDSSGTYTSTTSTITDSSIGSLIFYERLFYDRFSAGFKTSVALERTFVDNGTTVLETTQMTTLDFKAYFKPHVRAGFKPFLGVSFGNYTVKNDTPTAATVPITVLSFGTDYTMQAVGIRFEVGMTTGKRAGDSGGTFTYNGTATSIGVYSRF